VRILLNSAREGISSARSRLFAFWRSGQRQVPGWTYSEWFISFNLWSWSICRARLLRAACLSLCSLRLVSAQNLS